MIGIDTNVLVRFLMADDARQSQRAIAFMATLSPTEQGFVSLIVVSELVWILRYVFQLSRNELLSLLARLMGMPALYLESRSVFLHALRLSNSSSADFVDCLIAGIAKQAGCISTVTFDRNASKIPGMQRIV